ncbi:MAG: tRNA (adenosine(37)-N6)-threonylcarbamoyltransferase complex ATPase subunit type 1 TsaE [Clostridia bacterium]|nr:tRNA (adenosine(37)-N6)-threonylcarbamoyltransferase complex ATPase subunit type 1 TsaE [Clostridia bacterium]
MRQLGELIGGLLKEGSIVCLAGDLGSGKTVLAGGIAKGLGINEHVTSPTFTLIKEYTGRIPLYHVDVYRLYDPAEIFELGLDEYLYGQGVTVIEWADRIKEYIDGDYLDIMIEKLDDDKRGVIISSESSWYTDIIRELDKKCTFLQ